jgi:hypothetical protein
VDGGGHHDQVQGALAADQRHQLVLREVLRGVEVPHLRVRGGVPELPLAHVRRHHALVVLRHLSCFRHMFLSELTRSNGEAAADHSIKKKLTLMAAWPVPHPASQARWCPAVRPASMENHSLGYCGRFLAYVSDCFS